MKFQVPLVEGKILKRYKRFLADIQLSEDHNEAVSAMLEKRPAEYQDK